MPIMRQRGNNYETNALRVWQILTAHAILLQTISFERVAELLGWGGAGRAVGGVMLDMVANYCHQERCPDLTWVLVNKGKNYIAPTSELGSPEYQCQQREEVFKFPWFNVVPPTPEDLRSAPNSPYTDHWRGRQSET